MSTPYNDPSNRKFCGSWEGDCSLENHCPTGEECDILSGLSCFETTTCNAHELLIELLGQEGVDSLIGGDEEKGISGKMDPNDPRRNNFCGTSWGSANSECSQACPGGEDTDCPPDMGCYGDLSCYFDDDLMPTFAPTTYKPTPVPTTGNPTPTPPTVKPTPIPTNTPVTSAPIFAVGESGKLDKKFCGLTWSDAISSCSIDTLCEIDSDCDENETCYSGLPSCGGGDSTQQIMEIDIEDDDVQNYSSTQQNAPLIDRDDPSNLRFCGASWGEADDNCSLETHCPDGMAESCPVGLYCMSVSAKCNLYDMIHKPTHQPTHPPTLVPSSKPTSQPTTVPSSEPTPQPTAEPTDNPSTHPSFRLTFEPTVGPSREPISVIMAQTSKPTFSTVRLSEYPTVKFNHPSQFPTVSSTLRPSSEISIIVGDKGNPTIEISDDANPLNLWCGTSQADADERCGSDDGIQCPDTDCPSDEMDCFAVERECIETSSLMEGVGETPMAPTVHPVFLSTQQPNSHSSLKPTVLPSEVQFSPNTGEDVISEKASKFFCVSRFSLQNFESACGHAVVCNDENICPPGQFCIQHSCEQPPKNDYFCPPFYSGWYYSRDCKRYHICDNGSVSETFRCRDGLRYDRVRNECSDERSVNVYCNGPPLEEKALSQEELSTREPTQSPQLASSIFGNPSPFPQRASTLSGEPSPSLHIASPTKPRDTGKPSVRSRLTPLPHPTTSTDSDYTWEIGTLSPTAQTQDWSDWFTAVRVDISGARCLKLKNKTRIIMRRMLVLTFAFGLLT